MQHEDFSIALFGKQSLLCLPNKDKVTSLNLFDKDFWLTNAGQLALKKVNSLAKF